MRIIAIDPGPEQSAAVAMDDRHLRAHWFMPNVTLANYLRDASADALVIEKIEGMGMAVGAETFETAFWSGVFAASFGLYRDVHRIGRRAVKLHLCGSCRAKDANVRQAILDRYGGSKAKGTKKEPGPLYGIASHAWSALAVGVTFLETRDK